MGFRISYIVAMMPKDVLLSGLNLTATNTIEGEYFDLDWVTYMPEKGVTILWSEDEGFGYMQEEKLLALSKHGSVFRVQVNETLMCSDAVCFQNGSESWRIVHGCGAGSRPEEMEYSGKRLPEYEIELEKQRLASKEDSDVDFFFGIPMNIVHAHTGFIYYCELDRDQCDEFQQYAAIKKLPTKPNWLKGIFGS